MFGKKMLKAICIISSLFMLGGCSAQESTVESSEVIESLQDVSDVKELSEPSLNTENKVEEESKKTIVRGSFTVSVRDVIPDYCLDDTTPTVAVVTQYQDNPFTMYVGEEIGRQLEIGKTYVFTIEPREVDYSKEVLKSLSLASLVWEIPRFKIVEFRVAEENETGLASLNLTIE